MAPQSASSASNINKNFTLSDLIVLLEMSVHTPSFFDHTSNANKHRYIQILYRTISLHTLSMPMWPIQISFPVLSHFSMFEFFSVRPQVCFEHTHVRSWHRCNHKISRIMPVPLFRPVFQVCTILHAHNLASIHKQYT